MQFLKQGNKWMATVAITAAFCAAATAQVQHGTLTVVENDGGNNSTSVSVTPNVGHGSWTVLADDCSRADYTVDFGTGNDIYNGVLMVGSAELERIETSVNDGIDPYYATIQHARNTTDALYWVVVQQSSAGPECNADAALAYFPIADGWHCGAAYNSSNGGVFTELVGHPDIVLSNPFDPALPTYTNVFVDQIDGGGRHGLHIDGIDMRLDGVLLACGAKNEDNFGMVYIAHTGDAMIFGHDNGANGFSTEQDPVAFVFVPEGTEGVTMGRITGTGRKLFHQGNFDVELYDVANTTGTFRLTIDGESPATGTLIVTPYNETSGNTIDNPIFVGPDNDGWIINGRDIAGMGLQFPGSSDVGFHFAFFKNGMDITPGTPSKSYLAKMNDVVSARFEVTEYTPDNGNGDMFAENIMGSENLSVYGDNRGDVGIAWLNARMRARLDYSLDSADGVFVGNATEFVRDNSPTGGLTAWTTLGMDNSMIRTHAATSTGGEMNTDFALAFFPTGAGFQQDADVQVYGIITDASTVGVPGNPEDGVFQAINWDNNNRFVNTMIDVTSNGDKAWFLTAWDAATGEQASDWDYGYVWLPYNTEGLIAGQIAADGTVISGTGDFTIGSGMSSWGFPVTTITIPGVNASTDGVLCVTSLNTPYAMSWEANPAGYFEVAGLDIASQMPDRRDFSFAYIPYDSDLVAPQAAPGDIDFDGDVDLDDWAEMALCIAGPNVTTAPEECNAFVFEASDLDDDGDADLADAAIFTTLF